MLLGMLELINDILCLHHYSHFDFQSVNHRFTSVFSMLAWLKRFTKKINKNSI